MPYATFTFADALLTGLEIALLFLWIWIAIGVIIDIFRSPDLSGWGKAGWLLLIVILPLLGVLIYLIARGHKMQEHTISHAQAQDAAFRQYVRNAASNPVDDVAKLEDLRNRGVLSEEEFQRAKTKALA
jgi:Short C-terminal domain/Phospholipase_D-nuclease N-terminal